MTGEGAAMKKSPDMTDKEALAFLRERTGIPWPEYMHFLEPDGTITSKRLLDFTTADWKRHIAQTKTLPMLVERGIIDQETFDFLLGEQEGHA